MWHASPEGCEVDWHKGRAGTGQVGRGPGTQSPARSAPSDRRHREPSLQPADDPAQEVRLRSHPSGAGGRVGPVGDEPEVAAAEVVEAAKRMEPPVRVLRLPVAVSVVEAQADDDVAVRVLG